MGSIVGNVIGGVVGGIFGKKGGDQNAALIQQGRDTAVKTLSPFVNAGTKANDAVSGALGVNGAPAQDAAFQNFLNSTGFQSRIRSGSQAITGNSAASGLLNSGSTLKRLNTFGQDLAQTGFNNFLGQLGTVADRGLSAGNTTARAVTNAGVNAGAAKQEGTNALGQGLSFGISTALGG